MQDSHHKIVISLIIAFTLLQLVILAVFGYTPYPDSDGYILIAEDCVKNHSWYPVATKLNDYYFLWNIGAINAVILSLKVFNSITPLLVIYCLMKGVTAALIYQIAEKITNKKTAFITLLLYILYPANYGEGTSVLSELPFMFFCILGIWLCITKKMLITGGMSIAVANWFRPMGIVFLLAILIYLFFIKKKTLRPLVGYIAMILLIGSMSYLRTGLFLYQAKTGWMALIQYSSHHNKASMAVHDRADWNVSQKDDAWRTIFFQWLKEHPKEYISQMPTKIIDTFVSDNVNMCTFIPDKAEKEYMYEDVSMSTLIHSFSHYSTIQWLTIWNLLFYYALLLTALNSLYYFKRETFILPISIIALGTIILLIAGHGEARFHIPFMPFIILLSSITITQKLCKE